MPFTTGEHNLLHLDSHKFDFNIQFEQLFFSIVPSALFIVLSLWRIPVQMRRPTVVNAPVFQRIKAGAIAAYVVLELTLLILATSGPIHVTRMFLAASALKLVSAIFMIFLSLVDHSKCIRPSILLNIYLFFTLLLDGTQARTLFLSSKGKPEHTYSNYFVAAVALKAVLLLLESKQKSSWLCRDEKELSPEETGGIFSLGIYAWLTKLFRLGYSKILTIDDLYPLDSEMTAKKLHDAFSEYVDYSKLGKRHKFGLVKVLCRTLLVPLLLPVLPRLALVVFTLSQALMIEKLLEYLAEPELDTNTGYGFIGAAFFIYSGIAVSTGIYWYYQNRFRTMVRSILVTEIFMKAMKDPIGISDDAALTLMSTDIERIRVGTRALHETWASALQAGVAAWLLYEQLGVVFVAALALIVFCFTGLGILISFTGDSQRAWMTGVQKRVGLTATVIASMKSLKISGLTAPISSFVQSLRVQELAAGARFRKIFICAALFSFVPLLLSPPVTFAFGSQPLTSATMFTSLALLTLLTYPLQQTFQAVPQMVSALACIGRIQAYLDCRSHQDFRQFSADLRLNTEKFPEKDFHPWYQSSLVIENGNFGWELGKFVLRDINARFIQSSLTIVIGPIGSGKSTLCKAILGEIPFSDGNVVSSNRNAHIGFCEQAAFLSNASLRDNIVGFSDFDPGRYAEIINATALTVDIATLPFGDRTNIGSDGISLSGGQKQRVALARALYLQSDMLVLDDIFSGLDANTEEHIFQQVFGPGGLLRRRRATVILCTHSVRHLPAADHVLVLENGTVTEQGGFGELMANPGYVRRLGLKDLSESDTITEDTTSKSKEQERNSQLFQVTTLDTVADVPDTSKSRRMGDRTVYKIYIKSMGYHFAALSLFFAALFGFFANFPVVWLSYWTKDANSTIPKHSHKYYVGIYALLQVMAAISLLLLALTLWIIGVKKAGANLHQEALNTVTQAPLSFFTQTDTGVVTNLFSQDLNLIDTELPEATLDTMFTFFQVLGQMAVMLTSSPYLGIAYPILGIILFIIAKLYLRTSRQLRLLDLEFKSPLYTHFLDTVKGIATLRAFGFIPEDIQKNARLVDTSQRPAYLLLMIQDWLSFVLGVVVMVTAVVLVTLSVQLHSQTAFAGASLYSLITLGEALAGIVLYYTRLETSLGAISRLKTFNETVKPEGKAGEDIIPPKSWPQYGDIELIGVSASYGAEEDSDIATARLALRNVQLKIKSGEKVAICGRTGSGKSSFILLLLKLLDPRSETATNILIDGTPLHRISRPSLRQRIIAVPQEAVFLPEGSTFRENLDPDGMSSDSECQIVLNAVELWDFVQQRGGLNAGMSAVTLSNGQRQLMSIGRALLRRRIRAQISDGAVDGGILLLDEVTSSVDQATERLIQEIIRTEFSTYTVLSVSHRLEMIMDFDKVVVMDKGEIVEVGKPDVLAQVSGTKFGELVNAGSRENM
ncbi:putative ABC multidrug transporter [Phaeosphaeriaceae sp. PMI808]|nr:putative ABC multidrug transporter [Phaeosphaeriaceae sp. PMI808]